MNGMDTVRVTLADRTYDIQVGPGLLGRLGEFLQPLRLGRRVGVLTHPELITHGYIKTATDALTQAGFEACVLTVPSGEATKSPAHAAELWGGFARAGLDRGSAIVAIGGGVIGDLAGFVAATLFRGIAFIPVPTTLLAQVDSSVGGKTGVNLPEGKNLVGAFWQPRLVVADVLALRTLSDREFHSGLAEVVKHAMIADAGLFGQLEREVDRVLAREPAVLQPIVARNCAIKAKVVQADEREAHVRAVLNFGHTVGHALEAGLGYGQVTHGEAVAFGMVVATALSVRRGLCPHADLLRLRRLLARLGCLPDRTLSPEVLENYVVRDKKMRDDVLQFVLTPGVGGVTLAPIFDRAELRNALHDAQG